MSQCERDESFFVLVDQMREEVVRIEVAMANDDATRHDIEDVLIELQGWLCDADKLLVQRAA